MTWRSPRWPARPIVRAGGTITWTVTVTNERSGRHGGPDRHRREPAGRHRRVPVDGCRGGEPRVGDRAGGVVQPVGKHGHVRLRAAGRRPGGPDFHPERERRRDRRRGHLEHSVGHRPDDGRHQRLEHGPDDRRRRRACRWSRAPTRCTYSAVGDVIDYDYVVTNTGNVAARRARSRSSDDRTTVTSCPATASLAPGRKHHLHARSYTITQADLDAGTVTNTATASADGVTSAPDSATVTAALGPGAHPRQDRRHRHVRRGRRRDRLRVRRHQHRQHDAQRAVRRRR